MSGRIKISGGILVCLLFPFSHSAELLYVPFNVTQKAGGDAWLSVPVASLAGVLVVLGAVWVVRRVPGNSAVEICRNALGKWLGSVVALLYVLFFAWLFSLVLRNVLDFTVIVLLPGTPGRVIAGLFGLVALYGCLAGLEPIGRMAVQVAMVLFLGLVSIPLLIAREFSVLQYTPILSRGFLPVLEGAWPLLSWFMESLVVLSLAPRLSQRQGGYWWAFLGVAGGGLALTYLVGLCILTFGPTLTSRFIFPVYSLVQMVTVTEFVERVELVLVLMWLSGMFIKASLSLYAASEATQHLLGLKSHRWAAVVLAGVGVALTQIWARTLDAVRWGVSDQHNILHGGILLGILLLLMAGTAVRSLTGRKETGHAGL